MKSLHFWTTGEDFTNLVRTFWREGAVHNAWHCLAGMDDELRICILTGVKKLEGSTKDSNKSLLIVDDDTKDLPTVEEIQEQIEHEYCDCPYPKEEIVIHLICFYTYILKSSFNSFLPKLKERRKKWMERENLELSLIAIEENELEEETISDGYIEPEDIDLETADIKAKVKADLLGYSGLEFTWNDEKLLKDIMKISPRKVEILQTTNQCIRSLHPLHILFQSALAKKRKNLEWEQIRETRFSSGYINTSGQFIGCPDLEHVDFIEELEEAGFLPKRPDIPNLDRLVEVLGWIKVSAGRMYYDARKKKPTVSQYRAFLRFMSNRINSESDLRKRLFINHRYFTRKEIESCVPF